MENNTRKKKILLLQVVWVLVAVAAVMIILFGSNKLLSANSNVNDRYIYGGNIDAEHTAPSENKDTLPNEDLGADLDPVGGDNDIDNKEPEIEGTNDGEAPDAENEPLDADGDNDEANESTDDIEEIEDKKLIAITFDDGPYPTVTNRILDILDENEIKATFFVLGNRVHDYPSIMNRIYESGHQIANHSYSHKQLTKLDEKQIQYEVEYSNEMINEVVDVGDIMLRPPYGDHNDLVDSTVKVPMITWSVDSEDWLTKDKDKIIEQVTSTIHENAIILMHDLYPTTADAVEELIPYLLDEGYEFVTVEELFKRNDVVLEAGKKYRKP